MKFAIDVYTDTINEVLKQKGYEVGPWLDIEAKCPEDLRFLSKCIAVWEELGGADYMIKGKEPVLASTPIVATPDSFEQIYELLYTLQGNDKSTATMVMLMTINYINSKEE